MTGLFVIAKERFLNFQNDYFPFNIMNLFQIPQQHFLTWEHFSQIYTAIWIHPKLT